jgi:dTDP-glucose 4,6-dehydratase
MKILVTGGAGFIGSAVIRRALAAGHSIVNVDVLTYAANLANLASVKSHEGYAFEQVDICDLEALRAVFARHDPDCVMHLAAESHVDRSIDGPGAFIQTNVIGTFNMLQISRAHFDGLSQPRQERFRFHHISTDEVYGDLGPEDPAFEETTAYGPIQPQKLQAIIWCALGLARLNCQFLLQIARIIMAPINSPKS